MLRSESKLKVVREDIRRQSLREKLGEKRTNYMLERAPSGFQEINLNFFLENRHFSSSSSKVFQTLEDYEITKSAFKSDNDYMVTQDRNGFVLIRNGQVAQIRSTGKPTPILHLSRPVLECCVQWEGLLFLRFSKEKDTEARLARRRNRGDRSIHVSIRKQDEGRQEQPEEPAD